MKLLDSNTEAKITALKMQIDALYKEAKARPSYMQCHICGDGDFLTKGNVRLKVKDVVHGYENRPAQSPRLCWRHVNGWAHSYSSYNPFNSKSAEEVDLHFAEYLAKQIMKESRKEKVNEDTHK